MRYEDEDPVTPLHVHFQSEKRSEPPHGEQQSQIDYLETRSDDAYDPADWEDYDDEFDPNDE